MSAELAGGIDALAVKAQSALAAGKLEWALRFADDALVLDRIMLRRLRAKKAAMLALAENTMNSQARNMLLSDYLLMTGQNRVPYPLREP